jgi:hypothetical protein
MTPHTVQRTPHHRALTEFHIFGTCTGEDQPGGRAIKRLSEGWPGAGFELMARPVRRAPRPYLADRVDFLTVILTKELRKDLGKVAEAQSATVGWVLRDALRQYLASPGNPERTKLRRR